MFKFLKKYRKKPIKQVFYFRQLIKLSTPIFLYKRKSFKYFQSLSLSEKKQLIKRVNYNCKLKRFSADTAPRIKDQGYDSFTYYLDLAEYLRFFPRTNRINVLFGDITEVPENPTVVKSRPIGEHNQNSVVLNLDKFRHFNFIKDKLPFESKRPELVWRGAVYQAHRREFVSKYYQHPLCNVGGVTRYDRNQAWEKEHMNIPEQLDYKYIFSIEGNDVATNLKWILSSNSLCFMPESKYETWFMEGSLLPDFHYVKISSDYSDVADKINYYNDHPEEAKEIIQNAHDYVEQFRQIESEDIVSYLVLRKYFKKSGQRLSKC